MDEFEVGARLWRVRFRCATIFLLTIIAIGVWNGRSSVLPAVYGQIPDTALQRHQIVEETRKSNELLSAILAHLRTQPIKVRIETTDKQDAPVRKQFSKPSGE